MKQIKYIFATASLVMCFVITTTCTQINSLKSGGPSTLGVFVGSSPCSDVTRALLNIPATANCELIKWKLILYQDLNTLAPTTYKLNCVYGLPKQGTNGLSGGGTKVELEGKWTVGKGTKTSPFAVVYQLDPNKSHRSVSFLKVDQNLLHLLDRDGGLMIGNAGWSYTLNRRERATPPTDSPAQLSAQSTLDSPMTTGPSIPEVFVGRSPCREVARELNRTVNSDCIKVKWELALYHDPNTLAPTTYKLKSIFAGNVFHAEGKWTMVQGAKTNPGAVVYQLDPDKPQSSLLLLKADDNIFFFLDKDRNFLIGNGDFSYTLNRTDSVFKN